MKSASAIFEDLIENYELVGRQIKALTTKQSEVDTQLSSIYHRIETANLSNEQSVKIMAELQRTLQERRIIKNELEALKAIKESMPFNPVENYLERKKNCRAAIKYYTNYEKDYFNNFSVDPESILV